MAEQRDNNTQLWQAVFKLYDRDSSGFADECDTVAAMISTGCPPAMARDMLARVCEDGRANLLSFQMLLEECVAINLADKTASTSAAARELVRHLLCVLKDFEQRAMARGEFMSAAESRHCIKQIKEMEEARQKQEMALRQSAEKSGVEEAHVMEAIEFNKAWTKNIEEFEHRALKIVQELTARQEAALAAFVEKTRVEGPSRVKPSKALHPPGFPHILITEPGPPFPRRCLT